VTTSSPVAASTAIPPAIRPFHRLCLPYNPKVPTTGDMNGEPILQSQRRTQGLTTPVLLSVPIPPISPIVPIHHHPAVKTASRPSTNPSPLQSNLGRLAENNQQKSTSKNRKNPVPNDRPRNQQRPPHSHPMILTPNRNQRALGLRVFSASFHRP
jgi:hypothetical protein